MIDWNDFDELSAVVPLLARIYPNGDADVNHFHAAGGTGFVIRELLDAGLLHDDVTTVLGKGLRAHCSRAVPATAAGGRMAAGAGSQRRRQRAAPARDAVLGRRRHARC